MRHFLAIALCACVAAAVQAAAAEPKLAKPQKPAAANPNLQVVELAVTPAQAARPALKWRLLPGPLDGMAENAAPLYMKAFLLAKDVKDPPLQDKIAKWLETPVEKLPRDEVRGALNKFNMVLHTVEMAARRSRCDWALPLREEEQPFAILLPEAMEARAVARLLGLRARLQIAEKNYAQAIDTLSIGYALARHVAEGPVLVNGLVGIAIAGVMNSQVEALAQAPGAPSLYWPLTVLPDPIVDLRPALEFEQVSIYLMFRGVAEARKARDHTPQEWQSLLTRIVAEYQNVFEMVDSSSEGQARQWKKLLTQAAVLAGAPFAKSSLTARGWPAQEVEAMPPAQALVLDIFETYDDYCDDLFKWFAVPYWQAQPGIAQADARLSHCDNTLELLQHPGTVLAKLLLPAVSSCRFAQARAQRDVAALRCVEAIRLYAAAHQRKLPPTLSVIADVPIPLNPITGKAFPYRVENDTAVLLADGPAEKQQREYRIRIAGKE